MAEEDQRPLTVYAERLLARVVTKPIDQHPCQHVVTSIRWRTIAGGTRRPERQCLACGVSASGSLPRGSWKPEDVEGEWDVELVARVEAERKSRFAQVQAGREGSDEWWARYDAHLKTEKWASLRARVLARAQGRCEGCDSDTAVEVHHLTYKHLGDEFLWELQAVCRSCHDRIHPHRAPREQ